MLNEDQIALIIVLIIWFVPSVLCFFLTYKHDKALDVEFSIDAWEFVFYLIPFVNIIMMFILKGMVREVYDSEASQEKKIVNISTFDEIKPFNLEEAFIDKMDSILVMARMTGYDDVNLSYAEDYRFKNSPSETYDVIMCDLHDNLFMNFIKFYIDKKGKSSIVKADFIQMATGMNTDQLSKFESTSYEDIIKIIEFKLFGRSL